MYSRPTKRCGGRDRPCGKGIKEEAMFYFGIDYFILILRRLVRFLEMAVLACTAVLFILAMMAGMCC